MNKKTKTITASALAIAMCASVATGATYALFTSESQVNVAVTSAKVDVEATVNDLRLYSHENIDMSTYVGTRVERSAAQGFLLDGTATYDSVSNEFVLTNLAPGDGVTFEIAFINNSNVVIKYRTLISNPRGSDLAEALEISVNGEEYRGAFNEEWLYAEAGAVIPSIPISVELPASAGNEWQDKTVSFSVSIEAYQGNADTTRLISSAYDLELFAKSVANGNTYAGQTVRLTKDIDLAGYNHLPIGLWGRVIGNLSTFFKPFCGTFDGGGHTIFNMKTCDKWAIGNYEYLGGASLFGCTSDGAVIKNLKVKDAVVWGNAGRNVYASAVVGNHWQGSLTFEKVDVENAVIAGSGNVGALLGIAGRWRADPATVTFTDCSMKNVKKIYVHVRSWTDIIGAYGAEEAPTVIGEETVVTDAVVTVQSRDEFYKIRNDYFPEFIS